jgi:hypothetical protein
MHAETLREVAQRNYRLQNIQLSLVAPRLEPSVATRSLKRLSGTISTFALRRYGGQAAHGVSSGARIASGGGEPQAASLPVVIGSGFHPFPFRTRKLSLIPPMVLHGKLCGRVGRCRHYFDNPREKTSRVFFRTPTTTGDTVSHALHARCSLRRRAAPYFLIAERATAIAFRAQTPSSGALSSTSSGTA